MMRSFQLDSRRQGRSLREATSRSTPVVIHWKQTQGWATLKTRFLNMNAHDGELLIEDPKSTSPNAPEILDGQNVEVSFRRGHKKCVFNTIALGHCQMSNGRANGIPAIRLQYPQEVSELQRRLYHRAAVPGGVVIPVDLWRGDLKTMPTSDPPICEGTMMDVSAGGISVSVPPERAPAWRKNETVCCSFLLEPMEPPVRVSGQVRHRDKMPDGRVRVGLRFMGLDTSPEQRETLQRITQLAARFRRV